MRVSAETQAGATSRTGDGLDTTTTVHWAVFYFSRIVELRCLRKLLFEFEIEEGLGEQGSFNNKDPCGEDPWLARTL